MGFSGVVYGQSFAKPVKRPSPACELSKDTNPGEPTPWYNHSCPGDRNSVQKASKTCDVNEFRRISRTEFVHDPAAVDFHGDQSEAQFVGDFLVEQAGDDEPDDFALPVGESSSLGSGFRRLLAVGTVLL